MANSVCKRSVANFHCTVKLAKMSQKSGKVSLKNSSLNFASPEIARKVDSSHNDTVLICWRADVLDDKE